MDTQNLITFTVAAVLFASHYVVYLVGHRDGERLAAVITGSEKLAGNAVMPQQARGTVYVSRAGAVAKCLSTASFLKHAARQVDSFTKFAHGEALEQLMTHAEENYGVLTSYEQPWIGDAMIRERFHRAVAGEGFDTRWAENLDNGPDHLFVFVTGRETSPGVIPSTIH
jgi:hypothetical protein